MENLFAFRLRGMAELVGKLLGQWHPRSRSA
jgi:hypothetical protein